MNPEFVEILSKQAGIVSRWMDGIIAVLCIACFVMSILEFKRKKTNKVFIGKHEFFIAGAELGMAVMFGASFYYQIIMGGRA